MTLWPCFYLDKTYEFKRLKKTLEKALNTDNIIDFSVDVGLIAFDVLASPILIVVRILRFYFKKFVNTHLKRFLKWFVHKVLRIK